MNTVKNNPYRIVGILAGTTAREQARQIKRLKQFIEAEQEPQGDFSFPALGNLHRTLESVEEAASKINLDSDRINAALFWFWAGSPITDEVAFEALKEGNIEAAYQIWDKLTGTTDESGNRLWNDVTKKNFSAFHNSAVLSLITAERSFPDAVLANIKFIECDYFENFIKGIVDETYKVVKGDIELDFLKAISDNIDNQKTAELVKYLNNYDFAAKQDFLKNLVRKPITQIEQKIESTKNKRKTDKTNALKAGEELFVETANDLSQLKDIVGTGDLKYSSIADKVANEILQCSIEYFNDNVEKNSNTDYVEAAIKLAQKAETVAIGNLVKGRIKDNLSTIRSMKDKEISQAIALLKSVKEAYEANKEKITAQVRIQERSLPWGQTINWVKVNEMIDNSIDWSKVADLIKQAIPPTYIDKIKAVEDQTKINEYKNLVNFLMGKVGYAQKSKIQYLDYWTPTQTKNKGCAAAILWTIGIIGIIILVNIILSYI
ncbi:MAG: hypothetical protein LBV32_11230 [Tannerellaceae bacterium]|jgi:hypothetical protein|nr:hypothetical protein [Tannerellaceae bacterium]